MRRSQALLLSLSFLTVPLAGCHGAEETVVVGQWSDARASAASTFKRTFQVDENYKFIQLEARVSLAENVSYFFVSPSQGRTKATGSGIAPELYLANPDHGPWEIQVVVGEGGRFVAERLSVIAEPA